VGYTDRKALMRKINLTEDSKRTVHLWLKLAEFDILIKHKARTEMAAGDALSRHIACSALINMHSTEIKEGHAELGQRSWNNTFEVLKKSRTWQGMQQEV
jgi:hypothetical protein